MSVTCRALPVAAAKAWNSLPLSIQNAYSVISIDCKSGSLFSIPGSGTEEFIIPGSRRDYRLAEIYQRTRKIVGFHCSQHLSHLANETT